MKILMVSEDVPHPAMGGLGKHAVLLAKAMARDGHEVDFLGSTRYPDAESLAAPLQLPGRFFAELRWLGRGWKEDRLGFFNPLRRPVQSRDFARTIMRRAAEYDVVHYHGHMPDVAAYIPTEVNFVQTRHDQGSDCLVHTRFKEGEVCTEVDSAVCAGCIRSKPNRIQSALSTMAVVGYRRRVAAAFLRHKTVFVSDMLRRNLSRTAGVGPWGVVIHNFVDSKALRATPVATAPDRAAVELFTAGKLYGPKGIEQLLEHMAGRLPSHMTWRIAGDGEEDRLRRRFRGEPVHFLGWQSYADTIALTRQADAVIVPSVWEEPCATTVLEALALGKTVYALHRGGTPELEQYALFPGQLKLFPDLAALAEGVLAFQQANSVPDGTEFACDVAMKASELVSLYRATRSDWERRSVDDRLHGSKANPPIRQFR